jgi:adenylate cyclase
MKTIRLSRLALSIDDNEAETLSWATLISAFFVHEYEGAIEMADRAVALNPNSFSAWNSRATSIDLRGCRRKRSGVLWR